MAGVSAKLNNMTFLITGANRGIGLELSLFALENNHRVIALVRDPMQARTLQHSVKENPKYQEQLLILKCDVTELNEIREVKERIENEPIDILINNAGIMLDDDETFTQLPLEKIELNIRTNALGSVAITQEFLPNLLRSSQPKLVCISSQMGSISGNSSGGYYAYRMSKAALNMFAKSFSIDYPKVTTLVLHPGWVRTDMGGPQAPIMPRESARGLFKVITEAGLAQTGRFFDYSGKEIAW